MELIEKFFDAFDLGTPVLVKWYYDGYYEDYYWKKCEEDCSKILEKHNISIEEFNRRIQSIKLKAKEEKLEAYKGSLNAVNSTYGIISGAYMKYPNLTCEDLLKLLYLLNRIENLRFPKYKDFEKFKDRILKESIKFSNNKEFRKLVIDIFKDK